MFTHLCFDIAILRLSLEAVFSVTLCLKRPGSIAAFSKRIVEAMSASCHFLVKSQEGDSAEGVDGRSARRRHFHAESTDASPETGFRRKVSLKMAAVD